METNGVPSRVLRPESFPTERRKDLNCDTFWKLMDRWHVPHRRALTLIGCEGETVEEVGRLSLTLSDEQAKVLSCLLQIDLTLAFVCVGCARYRINGVSPADGTVPLDAIGRCKSKPGCHSSLASGHQAEAVCESASVSQSYSNTFGLSRSASPRELVHSRTIKEHGQEQCAASAVACSLEEC
jgi:hypothetical protein